MKKVYQPVLLTFFQFGGFTIDNPVNTGTVNPPNGGSLGFWISRLFLFILPLVGIIGFLFFLWSGFQFLTSKGEPKALDAAKQRLTYAVAGLVIIFLAYSITRLVTGMFGLRTP